MITVELVGGAFFLGGALSAFLILVARAMKAGGQGEGSDGEQASWLAKPDP